MSKPHKQKIHFHFKGHRIHLLANAIIIQKRNYNYFLKVVLQKISEHAITELELINR